MTPATTNFQKEHMATLTIKDKTYAIDKLPDDAKTELINLQYVDAELARLSAQPYFKPQEPAT